MNSSDEIWQEDFSDYLNSLSVNIDQTLSIIIFAFGVVGNILNIIVLSQRALRINPCAWLFLTSSIANLISILVALSTRILAGWGEDPTDHISWVCKCRAFILFTTRTIAFWLIALATINRSLASSTNVYYRQINSLRNVKICSIIIVLFSIALYSQMFYCYDANLVNVPLKCYGKTIACRVVSDLIYGWFSIIIPLILMIIFGFRTVNHVRQSQTRIQSQIRMQKRQSHWTRQDHSLLLMLSIQIIIQALLTLPQVCAKFYISLTIFQIQTPLKLAVDHFLYNFTLLLSFIANSTPFYVYTLFGGYAFRKPLLDLLKKIVFFNK